MDFCFGRGGQEVGGAGGFFVVVVLRIDRLVETLRRQRKRAFAVGRHRSDSVGCDLRSGRAECFLPIERAKSGLTRRIGL
jgi:hypothetical protein